MAREFDDRSKAESMLKQMKHFQKQIVDKTPRGIEPE
jgi:hypothetical protein